MKKPDMPIYVPRGRRLAAESELPKLGEEKQLDRRPKKLEPELDAEIKEYKTEISLFSQEQSSILGSSEQVVMTQSANANAVIEVKTKSQGKKKPLKTVATDSSSEEIHGQKKAKSGLKANGRQKKNLIQTGISSQNLSNDSVEVVNDSTGNGGISVTAASDISEADNCDELSAHTDNSFEPSVNSLSADCESTETLFSSVAAGDASGMSATRVTTGALATDNVSVKQNQDLDHSATSCTELVMTRGYSLTNENVANCLGKQSRPDYVSSRSNVELATSEEQSWDALFDDSGEALHPDVMNQVTMTKLYCMF